MDKLRALQYFVTAAEARSFSRAARKLDVSVPAVVKLVNALELDVRATLFERSARGLVLTASGERYLDACQPLLAQLAAADQSIGTESVRPRGTLVLGAHPELIMQSWLARLHQAFPEMQIDIRMVNRPTIHSTPADAYFVHGWPNEPDMIGRVVAQSRLLTCAAPGYWARHGVPQRPAEIEDHMCLLYCNDEGTVNDLWSYSRRGEKIFVTARGWLISNNRQATVEAALVGEGVIRAPDLIIMDHLRSGKLVPVLPDWEMADAPPFNLLFAPSQRRNARVRLFADFLTGYFDKLLAEEGHGREQWPRSQQPSWSRRGYRRASAILKQRD